MLPQSYTFSHVICLNNIFQVLFMGNQRYQVPLFRYINQADDVSHLVRGRKLIGDKKGQLNEKRRREGFGLKTIGM